MYDARPYSRIELFDGNAIAGFSRCRAEPIANKSGRGYDLATYGRVSKKPR